MTAELLGRAHPGRISGLDGLRAISVTLVLLGHGASTIHDHPLLQRVVQRVGMSELGVVVFFVISGYLITKLLTREQERTGGISLSGFYRRRVLRIFPAFYVYLSTIAVLSALGLLAVTRVDLTTAATFLWNYGHFWRGPGNTSPESSWYVGHFWTLSLEEQFYLLWPLSMIALGRMRASWLAFGLVACMPLLRLASYFLVPESRGRENMMLHTGLDPIMFGCLLALCEERARFAALRAFLGKGWLAVGGVVVACVIEPELSARIRGFSSVMSPWVMSLCVVPVIAWAVNNPGAPAGRLLGSPVVVRVGVLSYSLYLWQQFFLTPIAGREIAPFPLNILLAVVAAELSYRLVERPFLSLRQRAAPAVPAPTAAGAQVPAAQPGAAEDPVSGETAAVKAAPGTPR